MLQRYSRRARSPQPSSGCDRYGGVSTHVGTGSAPATPTAPYYATRGLDNVEQRYLVHNGVPGWVSGQRFFFVPLLCFHGREARKVSKSISL
jgi:hypothetical protein